MCTLFESQPSMNCYSMHPDLYSLMTGLCIASIFLASQFSLVFPLNYLIHSLNRRELMGNSVLDLVVQHISPGLGDRCVYSSLPPTRTIDVMNVGHSTIRLATEIV